MTTYRGPASGCPHDVPLPPDHLPLLRAGRMRKQWRYVAVYGPQLSLCVGQALIGVWRREWWAVWDRSRGRLFDSTRHGHRRLQLGPGSVRVNAIDVQIELEFEERDGVATLTPAGDAYIWTRKDAGAPARGAVWLDGERQAIDGEAFVDDSAGYHAYHTVWEWSAGLGRTPDGRHVGWNLVTGLHDGARDSERTVWLDGVAREVGPVTFARDLSSVSFDGDGDGMGLQFRCEAVREHSEQRVLFASRYRQPFGAFAGSLPGGIELAEGYGVMEHHDVRW